MDQNKIDLNKLTQRELLIITHNKVEDLQQRFGAIESAQGAHMVKLAVMETKVKQWGGIWGVIGGGLVAGIISIIKLTQ